MKRVFTQTFGVVGAILEKDGKILLVREHSKGTLPDAGKWNQPAGWVDIGENLIDAVKREVQEETGYAFKPTALLGIYTLVRKDLEVHFGGTPHAIKLIFIGEMGKNDPSLFLENEIEEIKWFTPEEIYEMDNKTLRDMDIKNEVRDYFTGKRYPLEILHHFIQER